MFSSSWQILSIALSVLISALMIAGMASPLWIWIDDGDSYAGIGLFYRVGDATPVPIGFQKVKLDSDDTLEADHWFGLIALEGLSTFLSIAMVSLLVAFYIQSKTKQDLYALFRTNLWVSILAWIFNVIGLVVFIIYHGDILTEGPDISDTSFSWGGLICAFALLLQFGLTLIIYQYIWDDEEPPAPQFAQPFPSPPDPNTANQMFQAFYSNNDKGPSVDDTRKNLRNDLDRRLTEMLPSREPKKPPPPIPPRQHRNNFKKTGDVYQNVQDLQGVNRQAGFDNLGFTQSSPLGRRGNDHWSSPSAMPAFNRPGMDDEWVREDYQHDDDRRRSSLLREIDLVYAARSGDGLQELGQPNPKMDNFSRGPNMAKFSHDPNMANYSRGPDMTNPPRRPETNNFQREDSQYGRYPSNQMSPNRRGQQEQQRTPYNSGFMYRPYTMSGV